MSEGGGAEGVEGAGRGGGKEGVDRGPGTGLERGLEVGGEGREGRESREEKELAWSNGAVLACPRIWCMLNLAGIFFPLRREGNCVSSGTEAQNKI